ncbi:hypothetical protein BofuT4_uP092530.1 [Botrytis cinerea T4]|uniref:Uncharacterized protein n=1 Tax=Botryotinia fuckeliana (strain T4) TaxID=999810 RepID=G2YDY3_BOTF4|nr:hypothetical protein BofuT4_uP092530.1 [Botrytis cinerea T4]
MCSEYIKTPWYDWLKLALFSLASSSAYNVRITLEGS